MASPPHSRDQPETSSAEQTAEAAGTGKQHPLPLPQPPKDGENKPISLDVGGEGVRLDHMGPLVVNQDGTMSRINNWAEMSDIERENTLRILGKRNQQRLKKLREEKEAAAAAAGGSQ